MGPEDKRVLQGDVIVDSFYFGIFVIPSLILSFVIDWWLLIISAATLVGGSVIAYALNSIVPNAFGKEFLRAAAGAVGGGFASYLTLIGVVRAFSLCRGGTRRSGLATFDVCADGSGLVLTAFPIVVVGAIRATQFFGRATTMGSERGIGLLRGALVAWFVVVLDWDAWLDVVFIIAAAGWAGVGVLDPTGGTIRTFGDASALIAAGLIQTEASLRPSLFKGDSFSRSVLFILVLSIVSIITLGRKKEQIGESKALVTATGALILGSVPVGLSILKELDWEIRADTERDRIINAIASTAAAAVFVAQSGRADSAKQDNSAYPVMVGYEQIPLFIGATAILQGGLSLFLMINDGFLASEIIRASVLAVGGAIVLLPV